MYGNITEILLFSNISILLVLLSMMPFFAPNSNTGCTFVVFLSTYAEIMQLLVWNEKIGNAHYIL